MITSLQHPLVKHLVKLRDSSGYRWEQGRVLIQGAKMVQEVSGNHSCLPNCDDRFYALYFCG